MDIHQSSRRNFLKISAAGLASATATHVAVGARNTGNATVDAVPQEVDVETDVDVMVVGGGSAGAVAAIQAGRLGASTLLVERGHQLGGTTTTGGVSFPGLFDAWGKQIIAGVGWDLVREAVEVDGGKLPNFSKVPSRHYQNQVHVNQFIYAILAEEKCLEAGVEIAYYEFPNAIKKTNDGWEVSVLGFGTKRTVRCKQVIDCTGGAEVVGLMGYERLREDERQPGSYLYQLGDTAPHGRKQLMRVYVHGADSTNSRTVTEANLVGRQEVLKKAREGNKRLIHLQPETGFRESFRIVGEEFITVNDYTSGRVFDDAVAHAFYPVDLHTKTGVKPKPLKPGVIPTIPLGSLIPKGSHHVMVAGRSISSDRLANSGLRVQAPCMAMGQVSAVTAHLAAKSNANPKDVPLADIRATLESQGAIVPQV